jgi:hypothetical protein
VIVCLALATMSVGPVASAQPGGTIYQTTLMEPGQKTPEVTTEELSTPFHEFVPGFLGVREAVALSCRRWARGNSAARDAGDRSRDTRSR